VYISGQSCVPELVIYKYISINVYIGKKINVLLIFVIYFFFYVTGPNKPVFRDLIWPKWCQGGLLKDVEPKLCKNDFSKVQLNEKKLVARVVSLFSHP